MKIHILFLSAFLLFAHSVSAQSSDIQQKIDSLQQVIATSEGETRLTAYYDLVRVSHYSTDTTFREALLKNFVDEAQQQGNAARESYARMMLMEHYWQHDIRRFHKLYPEFMSALKKHEYWQGYFLIFSYKIDVLTDDAQYEQAISLTEEICNFAKSINNDYGLGMTNSAFGNIYSKMRRFQQAKTAYVEAIEYFKKAKSMVDANQTYSNLLYVAKMLKEYDFCLSILREQEKIVEERDKQLDFWQAGEHYRIDLSYMEIYEKQQQYDSVQQHLDKIALYVNHLPMAYKQAYLKQLLMLCERKKDYRQVNLIADTLLEYYTNANLKEAIRSVLYYKIDALAHTAGREKDIMPLLEQFVTLSDSLYRMEANAQLDELRTRYEVDTLALKNAEQRQQLIFAAVAAVLLLIIAVIIFINHQKIHRKNKTLVSQIQELFELQQLKENELLQKNTFQTADTDNIADLCPESRKDRICLTLRDLLLKEKIYRNPNLVRDNLMERLGINRHDLEDAFQFCFGMHYSEYINELRLRDAVVMLEHSDLSIIEISETVGFGTVRTFQRQFTIQYNMSPKNYRQLAVENKN